MASAQLPVAHELVDGPVGDPEDAGDLARQGDWRQVVDCGVLGHTASAT